MNPLSNFVIVEREYYEAEDNNRFAFSVKQAIRYYEFIIIVYERHKEISQKMVSHQTKMLASISARDSWVMTKEQMQSGNCMHNTPKPGLLTL